MATPGPNALFKLGDRVRVLHSGGTRGLIVEMRGPLGPGGMEIYTIRVRRDPDPAFIEVREDQLKLIPAKTP